MNAEKKNNDRYEVNVSNLISEGAYFIVKAKDYDVRKDQRLLVPFEVKHKIGFTNQNAQQIVEPKYDIIYGDVYTDNDLIRVGITYSYGYTRSNGKVQTYDRYKWGMLNSKGEVIFEPIYKRISMSDDGSLFILQSYEKGYCVVDRAGNIIIEYGKYQLIDGFYHNFSRVRNNGKWGIIDSKGEIVLPIEWDGIWNFRGPQYSNYAMIYKKGEPGTQFYFPTSATHSNIHKEEHTQSKYLSHFGEYAGTYAQDVAGYSDETINDAFEGDPYAYWNID
jgi:hypothetical protein